MDISGESLLVILGVGLFVGWLAGMIVQGANFGIIGDICLGIIGALLGSWLFPRLGISFGADMVSTIVSAMIGAVILLLILKLIRSRSGWRSRWLGGSRW